ncbi:hypothetical protein K402DRAFT_417141 [Aulographum hederae CBS 113979]|uniref:DUF7587 domain-containing protein n=1 Tax=Aulographum hederae CBS 113979 TaxID=1176131 RepID=A0A6G1HCW0_9PEZI|nr:hypothetical protein K402DRAFT_417141 [Aulographum hederae CBS 113979]
MYISPLPTHSPRRVFRAWNANSQSQFHDIYGFESAKALSWREFPSKDLPTWSSWPSLDTREKRQQALYQHADWRDKDVSPFVSFTRCYHDVTRRARMLQSRWRPGTKISISISIIDAHRLLAAGIPLLDAENEMQYYGIEDPYGSHFHFYDQEMLALWRVPREHVQQTTELDANDLVHILKHYAQDECLAGTCGRWGKVHVPPTPMMYS